MAVFFRRRGIAETKTKWKKYKVAYSGTATSLKIAKTGTNKEVKYSDGYDFPLSGDPTLSAQKSANVKTASDCNVLKSKIFIGDNGGAWQPKVAWYYIQNQDATTDSSGNAMMQCISVTAATARSLAIAGDYIEDVEDENASAYPDNGPLGLYWYIKQ